MCDVVNVVTNVSIGELKVTRACVCFLRLCFSEKGSV